MWLLRFVAPIYGVRELLCFLPKSANFLENRDTDCRGDKQSGSSPRIHDSRYVDRVKAVVGDVVEGEGYRPVRLSKFVVSTCSVRELPWSSPKSANFLKICDTRCRRGKHSKSFPWIYDSAAVDNVTADGGIVTGRDCRFVWFPTFVAPTCCVRELSRFSPKSTNFPENWDGDCRWNERFGSSPLTWARTSGINRLNRACKRSSPIPYGMS